MFTMASCELYTDCVSCVSYKDKNSVNKCDWNVEDGYCFKLQRAQQNNEHYNQTICTNLPNITTEDPLTQTQLSNTLIALIAIPSVMLFCILMGCVICRCKDNCKFQKKRIKSSSSIKKEEINKTELEPMKGTNDNNDKEGLINDNTQSNIVSINEHSNDDSDVALVNIDNSDNYCIICMDNTREYAFVPCGHLAVCQDCKDMVEAA
eukprot:246189_1